MKHEFCSAKITLPRYTLPMKTQDDIIQALHDSSFHMRALRAVRDIDLPQCWIAAGFIRNYVWDRLHGYDQITPLNDIDVIYFDAANQNEALEKQKEAELNQAMPGYPWSVKNQARMHLKNGDDPYESNEIALKHWCETVTPIGARLAQDDTIEIIAPLGVQDLLNLSCYATPFTRNKPSKLRDYRSRMKEKKWWEVWPKVTVYDLKDEM